jgi:hypothetical protein
MVVGPSIDLYASDVSTARRAYQIGPLRYARQLNTGQRAYHISHLLTYLATLAEAGQQTTVTGALHAAPNLDEATGRVIDEYLAEGDPLEACSDSAADLLVADLVWRGHSVEAGSLRDRLSGLAQEVLRRARARTRLAART